jgi:DNA repair exonuclease SbcCD ATPase subunit
MLATQFDDILLSINNKIIALQTRRDLYTQRLQELRSQDQSSRSLFEIGDMSGKFLVQFSDSLRDEVKLKIESIVTQILQDVMEDKSYEFKIAFDNKRGMVNAEFLLWYRDQKQSVDIVDASGGGIVDICSAILLFVFGQLNSPSADFIILDEAAKFLSTDKVPNFFRLLTMLAEKYNKQIIYATHHSAIHDFADNLIPVTSGPDGFAMIGENN